MHVSEPRKAIAIAVFTLGLMVILALALASTTWAAPGAQGTVPTPPHSTPQPTSGSGGGGGGGNKGGGGGNKGGGKNNNGSGDSGGGQDTGAQPAAAGTGSVCAIGDSGAQCTSGNLAILVGTGAVAPGSALTIEGSFPQPPCPDSPAGQDFDNLCYRYTWIDSNAQPLTTIAAPVQYCFTYGADQLTVTDNKPETMLVGFAKADGTWTLVKPTLDTTKTMTCATSNDLVMWSGLFSPKKSSGLLPTVGGALDNWWMLPSALFGFVLLIGAWGIKRKAS